MRGLQLAGCCVLRPLPGQRQRDAIACRQWTIALCAAHAEPDARANHRGCMMNGTDVARRVDAGRVRRIDVLCEG